MSIYKCEVPALVDIIDLVVSAKGTKDSKKDLMCFVPGCERKHFTFGMCQNHTRQLKKARPADFEAVKEKASSTVIICGDEGCKRKAIAFGKCRSHYQRIPSVKSRTKTNERKRKIAKGIKVIADFSLPFPSSEQHDCPSDDFLTLSYDVDHFIIKSNLRHLSVAMGNGQNLMMTKVTLNNLAEEGVLKFLLDEGNYNLGIIVSKDMETRELLKSASRPKGILEVPTSWKMYDS